MALAAAMMLGLSACAELTHLTRDRTFSGRQGQAKAVFVDAKQRAVYAAPLTETVTRYAWNPTLERYEAVPSREVTGVKVCAEPSPDALSAIAASQGLDLSFKDDLSASQAMSFAESAGSIGLRTQSIQLMRDAMYRICEGYLSGALSHGAYETLHRRLQNSMVAILAIEQLTGAVRARQLILGGSAGTGAAETIADLTAKTETALADLRLAEGERDKAKAKLASVKADLATATAAPASPAQAQSVIDLTRSRDEQEAKLADLETNVLNRTDSHKRQDEARRAALGGSTEATATGSFAVDTGKNLDPATAEEVAKAVQAIVDRATGLQFSNELCTTLLVGVAYREVQEDASSVKKCGELLDETKRRHAARTAMILQVVAYIAAHPNLTPAEMKLLLDGAKTPDADSVVMFSSPG
jgi:hypothetical protein